MGKSRIFESDIELWCGPNDDYHIDDAALNQYCSDIQNSTSYNFDAYVVPNMTIIDRIWNDSSEDSHSTTIDECLFDTLMSSFVAMIPVSGTTTASNQNDDVVLPTISIFGNAHYSHDNNTAGDTPTEDSTIVAINLQEILLHLITQQQ